MNRLYEQRDQRCRDIPLRCSQNSAVEDPAAHSASADGTNSCAFLSLVFCHLVCQQDDHFNESPPVDEFLQMASLAEEVMQTYPAKFNYHRDASALYDISDAYKILRSLHIIDKSLEFTELVISPNGVFSSAGRSDLVAALNKIHHPAATNVCLYTCGGFIFTIGCKSGNFFVMDTHSIGKELGGNGNGLLKVFFSSTDHGTAIQSLCDWVIRRLRVSGVKGDSLQSFLEIKNQR